MIFDIFMENFFNEPKQPKNFIVDEDAVSGSDDGYDVAINQSGESFENSNSGFDFRKISQYLIYAIVFLVPLFLLPVTGSVLDYNKHLLIAIFYLLDIIKTGVFRYRPSSFYLPVATFLLLTLVSSIFSINRYISFMGDFGNSSSSFLTYAFLALIFFTGVNVIDDRGKKLISFLTLSISLSLLLGVLQIVGLNIFRFLSNGGRSFNTFGSLNTLGMGAALALPLFMNSSNSFRGILRTIYSVAKFAGLTMSVFLLVLINWWAVWIIAFVALIMWMMFKVFEAGRIKMSVFALPLTLVVIGTFMLLIKFDLPLRADLPVEVLLNQSSSIDIVTSAVGERPLLGYGLSNFGVAYDQFRPLPISATLFSGVRFNKASSEIVTLIVENGLLALIGLLFFGWIFTLEIIKRFRNLSSSDGNSNIYLSFIITFVVLTFLYPLNITLLFLGVLSLLFFVISGAEVERSIELESSPVLSLVGSVTFIFVLVGVLAGGYFTVNRYLGSYYYAQALETENSENRVEILVNAVNSDRNQMFYRRELSKEIIALLANELNKKVPNEEIQEHNAKIQNNIVSLVDIAKAATDADPNDARNWSARGFAYQNLMGLVGGADNFAVEMYKESIKRSPNDQDIHTRLGNTYLAIADNLSRTISSTPRTQPDKINDLKNSMDENLNLAAESYQKAISLNNNSGRAIYNLAAVYERQGNLSSAAGQLEKLRASNPRDPSFVFQLGLLYYRNNQKDAAFSAWQQAVALFPDYSNARWYLSFIYEERGDLASALAQVKEIEKFNPNNELIKERIEKLEAGQRIIPPQRLLDQEPLQN